MGLVLIKERRILFSEFALSKSQYLYNKYGFRATLNSPVVKVALNPPQVNAFAKSFTLLPNHLAIKFYVEFVFGLFEISVLKVAGTSFTTFKRPSY